MLPVLSLLSCTLSALEPPAWRVEAREVPVQLLDLRGPASEPTQEISGLAWAGDHLLLLPECKRARDCVLWAASRAAVVRAVEGAPLRPEPWPLEAPGLGELVGFDGFEALAVEEDTVWVTAERSPRGAWIVPGQLRGRRLQLDVAHATAIEASTKVVNKGDEAVLIVDDAVWTLHELNGAPFTAEPFARRFEDSRALSPGAERVAAPAGVVPLPRVPYRVTDVTALRDGRFEVMNYLWSGDDALRTRDDPIARVFGTGPTHAGQWKVERIVPMHVGPPVSIAGPPTYLALDGPSRNWEGLARLGERGWLVVTDRHPRTLLGFVPSP